MKRYRQCGLLAAAALTLAAAPVLASATTVKTKGSGANAALFFEEETQSCPGGGTAANTLSVQVDLSQSTTNTQGAVANTLVASVGVIRSNGCTGDSTFSSGLFDNVGSLSTTALSSATITGQFILDDGTVLGVNLALTGTDTTSVGTNARRSIMGKTILIQRSRGSSRTASVSGTVSVNGLAYSASQAALPEGTISRNTGGEITIIKP